MASERPCAAEIIALAVAGSRVVRVAGAHDSHLVRVVPAALLHRQAVLPSLADVTAMDFRSPFHPAQKVGQYFVVRELVVGRKQWMGLGCALELMDFGQRLIVHALLRPGGINRSPFAVNLQGKHNAIAQVGVMRDRQQLITCLALGIHPVPEIFRMIRVQGSKGSFRHFLGIFKDDIAVHVAIVWRRSPLIGREGRKLPRLVVLVRNG